MENYLENQMLESMAHKEILSFREAAIYLDISESMLYKMTSKKRIPFYKPNGGKLYFKKCDLIDWMSKNRSDSLEERENEVFDYLKKNTRKKKGGGSNGI